MEAGCGANIEHVTMALWAEMKEKLGISKKKSIECIPLIPSQKLFLSLRAEVNLACS
jgi:hypothetical protein